MARRRGSVTGHGSGAWLVRIHWGQTADGKRVRTAKLIQGSKRDAEKWLTAQLARRDSGGPAQLTRKTLGQVLDDHFDLWSAHVAPQTLARNRQRVKLYVPPTLLVRPAVSLTPTDLQRWLDELRGRGLSPATVKGVHAVVRAALSGAEKRGELPRNVARLASVPRGEHVELFALSPTQAQVFLQEAETDDFAALWVLLLTAGLRPGEALGLKWDDVSANTLQVRRSLVRVGGTVSLDRTKTGRARVLRLTERAVKALATHRRQQAAARLAAGEGWQDHGLVFCGERGQPLDYHNLVTRHFRPLVEQTALRLAGKDATRRAYTGSREQYRKAVEKHRKQVREALAATGLDRLRPYSLRHSAATLLLAAGEHPRVVAEQLGHANVGITLNTYSHVLPEMLERAAARMDKVLDGASSA